MSLVFGGNLSKVRLLGSVFLHVFLKCVKKEDFTNPYFSGVAKKLSCHRSRSKTANIDHTFSVFFKRVRSIIKDGSERSRLHLFEAHGHRAFGLTSTDHVGGLKKSSRASRAVVVDVVDWDTSEAELVDGALTAS